MDGEIADRLFPALESMGVESIALRFGKQIQLSSHGPVGFAALCAPDLRSALQTIAEYSATRSTIVTTSLVEDNATIKIINHVQSTNPLVRRRLSEIRLPLVVPSSKRLWRTILVRKHQSTLITPNQNMLIHWTKIWGTICRYGQKQNVLSIQSRGRCKVPLSDQSSYLDNVAKCRSILLSLSTQENFRKLGSPPPKSVLL